MSDHGTTLNENDLPGWYIQFQADVLLQLPRFGEMSEEAALRWHANRAEMKKALRNTLCPSVVTKEEGSADFTRLIVAQRAAPAALPMSIEIETDPDPFIPSGLSLKGKGAEHRGMGKVKLEKREDGQLYINGRKAERYLSPNQKDGNTIKGYALAEELKDEPTLNARILDALYENQQLIPEDWKTGETFFWATKFRYAGDYVFVECLCFGGRRWYRHYYWLEDVWRGDNPAARLAEIETSVAEVAQS